MPGEAAGGCLTGKGTARSELRCCTLATTVSGVVGQARTLVAGRGRLAGAAMGAVVVTFRRIEVRLSEFAAANGAVKLLCEPLRHVMLPGNRGSHGAQRRPPRADFTPS